MTAGEKAGLYKFFWRVNNLDSPARVMGERR